MAASHALLVVRIEGRRHDVSDSFCDGGSTFLPTIAFLTDRAPRRRNFDPTIVPLESHFCVYLIVLAKYLRQWLISLFVGLSVQLFLLLNVNF